MKFILVSLLLSSMVFAQNQNDKMRVMIIDENIKESDFPAGTRFDKRKRKNSISRFKRDDLFRKLNLSTYAAPMDELDRDILYINLKSSSVEDMIKIYPNIPPKVLTDAKNIFNQ